MENQMKKMIVIIIAIIGLLLVSCSSDDKSDSKFHYKSISEMDTLHTSIVYENEYIQIINVELHQGEMIPAFESGGRLIYSLTDYDITMIENGNKTVKSWKFGDIHWHDHTNFSLENNDTLVAKFSIIKRTNVAIPKTETTFLGDDVTTHAEHVVKILDNDQFKVVRVTLAPGESIGQHTGIHRLYIPETDYYLVCQVGDVGDVELNHKIGDYRFFTPGSHGMKNAGETEAVYLLVSFKK